MNKLITILIVATALGAYAERPPSPGAYRHNAEVRQKQNKQRWQVRYKLLILPPKLFSVNMEWDNLEYRDPHSKIDKLLDKMLL